MNTNRDKIIIRTSIIGIAANLLLAGFKAVVGLASHSLAIVLDAVNNLSDAVSSIVTIIGTKLAGREPDKEHPLGHGRVEYLTAMVIAVIILYAGITSFIESVGRITNPVEPDYQPPTIIVVAAAIAVKFILGKYVRRVGEEVHSESLIGSGTDALLDGVISTATLLGAMVYLSGNVNLEGYLGIAISILILKAGIDMLRSTYSQILGERIGGDLSRQIKETITSFPDVTGAYDLILHNYGPDRYIGSVHIEIPDTYTAAEIDTLSREISEAVYLKHNVILAGIGIYALNTTDDRAAILKNTITKKVMSHPEVLQMHGFYLDIPQRKLSFDVIVDFAAGDRLAVTEEIKNEIDAMLPEYHVQITMDADISD